MSESYALVYFYKHFTSVFMSTESQYGRPVQEESLFESINITVLTVREIPKPKPKSRIINYGFFSDQLVRQSQRIGVEVRSTQRSYRSDEFEFGVIDEFSLFEFSSKSQAQ